MAAAPRFRSQATRVFSLPPGQAVAHALRAETADGPMDAKMTDRLDGMYG